jgi:polyferredoxin
VVHLVLIVGHALCGVVAFVVGCCILRPPPTHRSLLFLAYAICLAGLLLLMFAVVAWDWALLVAGQRITFSLLCVLGVYTGWRGLQAHRELAQRHPEWQVRYIDHLGFTLISLFDGFTIVAAIDLGAPLVVVLMAGVAGVAAGIAAMNVVKSRVRRAAVRA